MNIEPIADKWKAFGWGVITIDGHDLGQILSAFAQAKEIKSKPSILIAKTIKGKNVSFLWRTLLIFTGGRPTRKKRKSH